MGDDDSGNGRRGVARFFLKVPATNFSDEVLSARPSDLAVIRGHGLGWIDLGEPERVLSMLKLKAASDGKE